MSKSPTIFVYSAPGITGRDIVSEIDQRRETARRRKNRTRCLGTESCDCRRCR